MNENDEDVVHDGIVSKSRKGSEFRHRFCNSPPTGRKRSCSDQTRNPPSVCNVLLAKDANMGWSKKKNPNLRKGDLYLRMRDAFYLDGPKWQEFLHGAAWFAFGVALAACGWFSATTVIEGLRKLVPPETALFAAIGLQAGAVSSAYFFARLTRRRIYWFGAYLLIAGTVVAFSYLGIHEALAAGVNGASAELAAAPARPVLEELLTLRHPRAAEAMEVAVAGAFTLMPSWP